MQELSRVTVSGAVEGDYLIRESHGNGILEIVPVPDDGLPTVASLEQTCSACPSQWEGQLDDGRWMYARYRGGYLSIRLGDSLDEAISARGPDALFESQCGDCLDGFMETDELRRHLVGLLHFPEDLKVAGEPDWSAPLDTSWLKKLTQKPPPDAD